MSETRKVWKLLLKKEFYERNKNNIPRSAFDDIGQELYETLAVAHEAAQGDLSEHDILAMHLANHPTITTAARNSIEAYLDNIRQEDGINDNIADRLLKTLWRREVGRKVAEYGINLADGEHETVDDLASYISSISNDMVPKDFDVPVDTDPVKLFKSLNEGGKWKLNIPVLDRKIGNISPGQFIILLARPESGKTATIVNLIAGREGFAAQGANVHYIANEEGADRTAGRAACCFNELPISQVMQNPELANTPGWHEVRQRMVFQHKADITMSQLENYVKANRPDVIIVDQLDHVNIAGNYEKSAEKLGAVYRKAREMCTMYNMVIIAVSQASAEAENKSVVTYAMAENSKTSKAATADLIIGIGRTEENGTEESNCVLRHYTASKNKISGWRGTAVVRMILDQSRLEA